MNEMVHENMSLAGRKTKKNSVHLVLFQLLLSDGETTHFPRRVLSIPTHRRNPVAQSRCRVGGTWMTVIDVMMSVSHLRKKLRHDNKNLHELVNKHT